MRKRRCFADKQLETATFPKDVLTLGMREMSRDELQEQGLKIGVLNFSQSNYQINLLKKIFPNINENLLNLILRANENNTERTIEHLVKTMAFGTQMNSFVPVKFNFPHKSTVFRKQETKVDELVKRRKIANYFNANVCFQSEEGKGGSIHLETTSTLAPISKYEQGLTGVNKYDIDTAERIKAESNENACNHTTSNSDSLPKTETKLSFSIDSILSR